MNNQNYIKGVSTLKLDKEKCTGCNLCTVVCPHAVFTVENRKADIVFLDACMECGACAMNCSSGAITVNSGVGCAYAIIVGAIKGTEPDCGCEVSSLKSTCC